MMGLSVTPLVDLDHFQRLMIYGPPGAGKTTLAAQSKNPVFLDFENSTETLHNGPYKTIPVINDVKQLASRDNIKNFLNNPPAEYDTIVIDSVSSMYETLLMEHMRGIKGRDQDLALFQDFRKLTNVLKQIFYQLISVRKHVVIIAHEKELREAETNKLLQIRPFIPPEIRASIERLINELFYLEAKTDLSGNVTRTVTVSSQGKILAKNRQALTESKLTNPSWKDIYKNEA